MGPAKDWVDRPTTPAQEDYTSRGYVPKVLKIPNQMNLKTPQEDDKKAPSIDSNAGNKSRNAPTLMASKVMDVEHGLGCVIANNEMERFWGDMKGVVKTADNVEVEEEDEFDDDATVVYVPAEGETTYWTPCEGDESDETSEED